LNPALQANTVVYCPGPKAVLRLVENDDNCAEFP
jgi:hypothetical protein